jgi:hypothetical protein
MEENCFLDFPRQMIVVDADRNLHWGKLLQFGTGPSHSIQLQDDPRPHVNRILAVFGSLGEVETGVT